MHTDMYMHSNVYSTYNTYDMCACTMHVYM